MNSSNQQKVFVLFKKWKKCLDEIFLWRLNPLTGLKVKCVDVGPSVGRNGLELL